MARGEGPWYGLNCIPSLPTQIHLLASQHPGPQDVTVFGSRVSKEVIKLK